MKKPVNTLLSFGFLLATFLCSAQNPREALQLMYGEQYQSAARAIREIVKNNPGEPKNYYYAGYIYLNIGKVDSARYYFDKGIAVEEDGALNYVGKARLALDKGNLAPAQKLFEKALDESNSGNRAVVYNQVADALLNAENKNAEKAMQYLKKALEENIGGNDENDVRAETQLLLGHAWLELGEAGKAVSSYEDAMRLNKNLTARLRTKIGRIYLSARNSEAALREFEKAQQADPNFAPVYKYMGEVYFSHKKDVEKAKEMYQKYLRLSDISTGSKDRYAAFLYVSKDFDEAIPKIREVLQTDPKNIVMNRLLGYSLYKIGDYGAAAQAFERYFNLVETEKTLTSDFMLYGKTLMQTGQDSLAAEYIFKAVEKDSTKLKMVGELAQELAKGGKHQKAATLYAELLQRMKNPTSEDYYAAGRVFLQARQFVRADASFAKVIELSPDNYIGYYMMAISKFYQDPKGEKGLAKPYYEKVIEFTSAQPEKYREVLMGAYRYLATYYTVNENLEKAKSFWGKIEALDPGNENAQKFFEYYQQVQEYKRQKAKATQN